jgi:hypothetical protein
MSASPLNITTENIQVDTTASLNTNLQDAIPIIPITPLVSKEQKETNEKESRETKEKESKARNNTPIEKKNTPNQTLESIQLYPLSVDQTPELAFEKINEGEPLLGHKINSNSRYGAVHEASPNHTKDTRKETNGEIIKFSSVRLVNKDGSLNIKRISVFKTPYLRDYFHTLVNGPWSRVLLVFTLSFAFMALIFGVLLFLERDGLTGDENKTFGDIYFFSLEIMTTITFGDLAPYSFLSKLIFASETFLYTIFQACIFAIFTTKFAQAQSSAASIIFSEKAIITQKDNSHFFVFRIANLRKHQYLFIFE